MILSGAGERAFVGGADIAELAALDQDSARDFITLVHRCCDGFRRLGVPVIARIDGYALGAGLELAAACDLRVASERAMFGMPEVRVGIPSVVEAALLPQLIGHGRARRLLLTGETIGAAEALAWGLVDAVAPPAELDAAVERFAAAILAGGKQAIRLQKALIRDWEDLSTSAADRARHRRLRRSLRDRRAAADGGGAAYRDAGTPPGDAPMTGKGPRSRPGLADMAGAIPHFYGHRQRLRQRLIAGGPDNLPDYELLEVMLFAGNPRGDVKPLAKDLIDRFGSFAEVLSADSDDLLGFPGLGEAGVAALKSVREAALRLMRAELRERPLLGSWDRLIDYCTANIAHGQVEEFHLLFLDRKNMLIAHERQQRGTIDHTPVYPREVVKRALELSASALILVHNHPSGDPTPSKADIQVTRDIVKAAGPLGVTVHDHVIIGRGRHTSLRDMGLL